MQRIYNSLKKEKAKTNLDAFVNTSRLIGKFIKKFYQDIKNFLKKSCQVSYDIIFANFEKYFAPHT